MCGLLFCVILMAYGSVLLVCDIVVCYSCGVPVVCLGFVLAFCINRFVIRLCVRVVCSRYVL